MQAQNTLLQTQVHDLTARLARNRDFGEVLKVDKPTKFNGTSKNLPRFLTQLRLYQSSFPRQFTTKETRVKHAAGYLEGKALNWFEPILRDYTRNNNEERQQAIKEIFASYKRFEKELTSAFGIIDEKRAAEYKIKNLRQTKAASEYAAEFRNLASLTEYNE